MYMICCAVTLPYEYDTKGVLSFPFPYLVTGHNTSTRACNDAMRTIILLPTALMVVPPVKIW